MKDQQVFIVQINVSLSIDSLISTDYKNTKILKFALVFGNNLLQNIIKLVHNSEEIMESA